MHYRIIDTGNPLIMKPAGERHADTEVELAPEPGRVLHWTAVGPLRLTA